MSIFDFIQEERSLEEIPLEEAVEIISRDTGIKFAWNTFFGEYRGKVGPWTVELHYGRFSPGVPKYGGQKFISTHIEDSGHCGAGSPCISIEEAVSFIDRHTRREE